MIGIGYVMGYAKDSNIKLYLSAATRQLKVSQGTVTLYTFQPSGAEP